MIYSIKKTGILEYLRSAYKFIFLCCKGGSSSNENVFTRHDVPVSLDLSSKL